MLWAVWRIARLERLKLITYYSLIIALIIVCAYNSEAADLGCDGHFFVGVCLGESAGCPGTSLPFFFVVLGLTK